MFFVARSSYTGDERLVEVGVFVLVCLCSQWGGFAGRVESLNVPMLRTSTRAGDEVVGKY